MKDIIIFIKESMVVESQALKLLTKLDSVINNDSKLKTYIKSKEEYLTSLHLGSSDITDIKDIMQYFHAALVSMAEEGEEEDIDMYIEDAPEILSDDFEEDWVEPAIYLYKKLYKETNGKDLVTE